ncbi:TPA: hypothetical protein DCP76_01360 [Patescibacteria group bacterium]|nr:hypothetical protein [Patescibacteria group bacterium]HAM96433.1 hypothetical protein [Patescibacteria group bacterium]
MTYTPFTQWMITTGVPQQVLELLLAVMIVATIVSIARYIIGSKTYGIYAPIILAIAYSYTGLKYGLAITLIVILTTLLSYTILRKVRMHYIARIAVNYCLLSIMLVVFFIVVERFGLGLENMTNISGLAVISIAALSDFFIKQYVKKSFKSSVLVLLGTVTVAALGWFIITRDAVSEYFLNNLWIVPLLIVFNILIGQFAGLRVKDLFRFKSISQNKDNVQK